LLLEILGLYIIDSLETVQLFRKHFFLTQLHNLYSMKYEITGL